MPQKFAFRSAGPSAALTSVQATAEPVTTRTQQAESGDGPPIGHDADLSKERSMVERLTNRVTH
ncbi:hypothetical protein [Streptomyces ipomoeae]|uniref:hypothetical protein n=1 Tax=Streptomyces ipomoeae TaxID=103232 RepID=UPI0011474BE4|nr:hypothetical protein [Streptomyces ipomoeae]MDX2932689.1 hypothetical protein [Streptomyces ipomoeae]TQE22937.1 hypothetical protein SipoB123_22525 [Streptomyces ipomoeae]